jgi:hypothetical protein
MKLYPDDLAAALQAYAGKKYRPSNGSEGEAFMSHWCNRCVCDINEDCRILGDTFMYEVTNPEYPQEWHYGEDGQPLCSAFRSRTLVVQPEGAD